MKIKYALFLLVAIFLLPAMVSAQNLSITSSPVLVGEVNSGYEYQVTVDNPQNYSLTYSVQGPSQMTINSQGLVTWIPTQTGSFDVNVTVSNSTFNVSQAFTVQVTAVPSQLNAQTLELGSNSQRRGDVVTTNYEISNTGSFDITNLEVEFVNIATRYNAVISLAQTTIPAKGSVLASVTAQVPENQDGGRVRIGQLIIRGESENSVAPLTRDVFLTAENMLVIESVEVTVGGRRERLDSEGAIRREAQIDDRIEIVLRIRNDFDDIDIEDIEAELFSLDIDAADGQTSTLRRLRPQRTSTDLRFDFVIDPDRIDIDDSPFDLEIVLFGIDENNARHGETWILELDIERQNRDIRLSQTTLMPSTVTCQNRFFTVETVARNIGLRDLSTAMVSVNIPSLNIQEFRRNLDLFTGDTRRVVFNLNIPENTPPGQYTVEVYGHPTTTISDFTDSEVLTLVVGNCPTTQPPSEGSTPGTGGQIIVQPTQNESTVVVGRPVVQESGSIFQDQQTYIILLGIMVVLLFVTLIIVLLKLLWLIRIKKIFFSFFSFFL